MGGQVSILSLVVVRVAWLRSTEYISNAILDIYFRDCILWNLKSAHKVGFIPLPLRQVKTSSSINVHQKYSCNKGKSNFRNPVWNTRIHVPKSPIFIHWLVREPGKVAKMCKTWIRWNLGDVNPACGFL